MVVERFLLQVFGNNTIFLLWPPNFVCSCLQKPGRGPRTGLCILLSEGISSQSHVREKMCRPPQELPRVAFSGSALCVASATPLRGGSLVCLVLFLFSRHFFCDRNQAKPPGKMCISELSRKEAETSLDPTVSSQPG